ncbi:MAG: ABC transporter substrate-binding protein, partial [Candidatus Nomurabacteria bacterium]|nr:ABC transporter substrate-binding protein [Candidatus Nomurabacteria bacterium]
MAKKRSSPEEKSAIDAVRQKVDRTQKLVFTHIKKVFVGGWDNLRTVRREVIGWLSLACILVVICIAQATVLSRNTHTTVAADGGTYMEGVVDKINTINPLYVTTNSEIAASSLIYQPLFSYDETGHLKGILAESWSMSDDGKTYNVKLRDHIKWSDG